MTFRRLLLLLVPLVVFDWIFKSWGIPANDRLLLAIHFSLFNIGRFILDDLAEIKSLTEDKEK